MVRLLRYLVLLAPLAGAGCRQAIHPAPLPDAHVSYHPVTSDATVRYQLTSSQTAILPAGDHGNPAPVYPPQLLAQRLPPVEVLAKVIVDDRGHVSEVRVAGETEAGLTRRAFDAAVRAAALQWTFTPLRLTQWVERPDGSQYRVSDTAEPFSQDYLFRFELRNGKPVVSAGIAPASN